MPQNTNLNAPPYFDDFDVTKNYQRVLFKPGTPIQARELTTLQSLFQNQVEKFGKHFFKEGAVVIPGNVALDPEYFCVQIDPTHLGVPISLYISNLLGKLIKGETSGVTAKVENIITDSQSEKGNYTLYIKYRGSSETDFSTNTFLDAENLIVLENIDYGISFIREGTTFATTIVSDSISTGSAVKIEDGVYFIRGFFVDVFSQTLILDQYSNVPTYRIGLSIDENIAVASQEYPDLYDNARGFSNFAAPGADRLRITATLIKKSIDDLNDENFVELMRIIDGERQIFIPSGEDTTSLIKDELARRTNDESGDYYVIPFKVEVKESLNDKLGNNGIYNEAQLTSQGNVPSDDLLTLQISPGKAYVRGYEIETLNTVNIDVQKPRSTETESDTSIEYNLGNQIRVNNVYGTLPIGYGTTVKLFSNRTVTPGSSSGFEVGVAQVYDLKLENAGYTGASTVYELTLFDVQTYDYLILNSTITLPTPCFIQGKHSSANGYLASSVTNSNQLILYGVNGTFVKDEPITINGREISRTIKQFRDFGLDDVCQITSLNGTSFTSDTVLTPSFPLAPTGSTFTISTGGVITNASSTFGVGISTGDIVVYVKPGEILPTYNRVTAVNAASKSITVQSTTSVVGVSSGLLPTSPVTTSELFIVTPEILNNSDSFLFSPLPHEFVSSVELENAQIIIRKTYLVTITNNSLTSTLESDSRFTLEPFDEEDYSLVYTNGNIEPLSQRNFSASGRTISLNSLSENGDAILTVTLRKTQLKARKKIAQKATTLLVDKSSNRSSGVGGTSLNDGLTYSDVYGIRVQDQKISLNVCDVKRVLGVFESSSANEPELSKIEVTDLNANILNSIVGELIQGQDSGTLATLVSNNGSNIIEFVYNNENNFVPGEKIILLDSKITAVISAITIGDRNIAGDFEFINGQTAEICDYSYIVRKQGVTAPSKKLKIIYQNYIIDSNDDGDFVTVDSFDSDLYSRDLIESGGVSASDIIDLRPRVLPYDSSTNPYSPFEFFGRHYDPTTSSTPFIFANNKNILLSYSYYLPRTDVLYLTKDGRFLVSSGIPSLDPQLPQTIEHALEVGVLEMPAYVGDANSLEVRTTQHKRYRMREISRLEDRLKNVEYYTSLSLLETDTKNLSLKDPDTGLDRFKCGFFVDNFKSDEGGSLGDPGHRCSIDIAEGNLRPQHYTTSIDLLLGSEVVTGLRANSNPDADFRFVKDLGNPNTVKVGDTVCLKYTNVSYVRNKFATRFENVNPFHVVNWIGQIELKPATDTWIETKGSKKTIDQEGTYTTTMQTLGVDSNTGLSPVTWGSWETTWTGKKVTSTTNMGRIFIGSQLTSSKSTRKKVRRSKKRFGIQETTTNIFKDQYTQFDNITTLTTTKQSRQGIQYKVGETFELVNLGKKVISTEVIHTMRSRNIEFISRRFKPKTRLYAFFDNVDMKSYVVPKLVEISMTSGTFAAGETIRGTLGRTSIRVRLARANHKYGPYLNPDQVFVENPYKPTEILAASYSTTSTILNLDTASLEIQSASGFYGHIRKNMTLIGETSGATAKVADIRLITDAAGTLIGSLFLPDYDLTSAPSFTTGTKTFVLSTSPTNATISGTTDSTGEARYTASGTLQNVEETTLRIRNATVERINLSQQRTLTSSSTDTVASTLFTNRSTTQTRWVDPLAQSFEVVEETGVFVTKCDIYFRTKDTSGLPVTLQIRTMQTGLPTQTILPFGEVILEPSQVRTSPNGTRATTFTFPSPVYLEGGNSYCVVLLSASNEYTVAISRMGEEDVTTLNLAESEKIIVSQQPLLGSLFKSQNGATWDPSQLEDLKMDLYRASFVTEPSTVRFYNPELNIGNKQIVTLRNNPLDCISRSLLVGVGKSLTNSEQDNLTSGVRVLQQNNPKFVGFIRTLSGSIGISSNLTITSAGAGFTSGFRTYSNVDIVPITGRGVGAKVDLSVNGGVAVAATVSVGGTGYNIGDTLEVNYSQTDGLGDGLILSIPNSVGILSAVNGLLLDRVQGNLIQNTSDFLYYVGTGGTTLLNNANVTYIDTISDGLHFKVNHNNHGMYSSSDRVTLISLQTDQKPEKLSSSYSTSSTENITLSSVGIFTSFENLPVSAINPGYILIGNEVIRYTGVTTSSNILTGITRKIDSTLANSYTINTDVFKYELNGISLRRINKTHNLSQTDLNTYPTDLDYYYVKVNMNSSGTNRTSGNPNAFPELYFREDKSCGSNDNVPLVSSDTTPSATQNIPFNQVRANIQTLLPQQTTVSGTIRTFSGSSPDSNLIPFIDQGFVELNLDGNTEFQSPRIICSSINEQTHLANFPGKKSLTIELTMKTDNQYVSPQIDLDRVNLITTANRINSKVSNYTTDPRVNSVIDDPTAAVYISKPVFLAKPADNLKVFFDAYRHFSNDIRVMYRIFRPDRSDIVNTPWQLFPGYANLDINSNIIDETKNDGTSDKFKSASTSSTDFKSYEFTIPHLPQFTGYQIKIHMLGTNSSFVPKIRDLRVIASI
jgi:phosphoribosyl-AMP cyclohydrolase